MALDSTPLTETSTFDVSIYPPKGGTSALASDVADGEQHLANRTKYLNDTKAPKANPTFTGTVTVPTLLVSGDINFSSPHSHVVGPSGLSAVNADDWTPNSAGARYARTLGATTGIGWAFTIPAGATITSVRVRVVPAGMHAGLPGTMPQLQLYELSPSDDADVQITSVNDTSGSVVSYEAAHDIVSTGLSYVVSNERVIQARVYGEGGANEKGGDVYSMPRVTYTLAKNPA